MHDDNWVVVVVMGIIIISLVCVNGFAFADLSTIAKALAGV